MNTPFPSPSGARAADASRLLVRIIAGVFGFAVLAVVGCAGRAPRLDTPASIGAASGFEDVIIISEHGEALDVSEPSDALSLAQASRLALQHDPSLQAALARVRVATAEADQARLLPNPILSVAVRFPEAGTGDTVIDAGIAADLLAILQQPRRVSAADARMRTASAEALSAALDLLLEVQTAYVRAQALEARAVVLEERRTVVQRLLALARSRVELGESPQLDVLTLDAERLSLDVDIAEAQSDIRQRRIELSRLIGQPSGPSEWRLDRPGADDSPVARGADIEQAWLAQALEHRPEIQAHQWELSALGADVALTGWAWLDSAEVGVAAERDSNWTVGPAGSVPIPLFDFGQARRDKATAAQVEARHKLVEAQRRIVQEVRQALSLLGSGESSLRVVRDELIPLQQRRIEQAEAAYRNGLADITAVLIAEQESQESRQKLIELQQRVALARLQLHRAVGGSGIAHDVTTLRSGQSAGASAKGPVPSTTQSEP